MGRPVQARAIARKGFSILELVVTLAVILILASLAVPSLTRSYEAYRFNSSASQLAGMLKLARFEAIRRNAQVSCQIQPAGTDWLLWIDPNNNPGGPPNNTESQYRVTGSTTLLAAGGPVPAPAAIIATLNVAGLTTLSGGGNATVTFDSRGAVVGPPQTYVLYIGNVAQPGYGYRAVVLLTSGAVHVWTAGTGGPWQQVS